ncbi:MAG: GH3 auxin-responsive promoter family protein [Candidatus Eisenbacteria bacterium]|nr:GH3 auxin-responsive promoter family protein [Candidatus Eisenbacteria bacterium]
MRLRAHRQDPGRPRTDPRVQEAVPVRTHAEMREDLDAVYEGDWQRLCPSRPLFFAMTAGSTGRFKYIPFTAEFREGVA